MELMDILEYCEKFIEEKKPIIFSEDQFKAMTDEDARAIVARFGDKGLFRLPYSEIYFFEWLKEADSKVWEDLWTSEMDEPYIVSLTFLPKMLLKDGRGFPICDLLSVDNYYFTQSHMVDEESKILIETAKTRFLDKEPLTVAQLLALEISMDPIDIWHFAFKHSIDLQEAKEAVAKLVEDKALVHLTLAEYLAPFVEV